MVRKCRVHTTPDESEINVFTVTSQMCSVHTMPEKFQHTMISGHCGFVFDENLVRKIT